MRRCITNDSLQGINGYQILRGRELKKFILCYDKHFGADIYIGTKTTVLGVFDFRAFFTAERLYGGSRKLFARCGMIETERLEIYPLNAMQLKLWTEDIEALEKELHCFYKAEPMEGFFLEIVKGQLAITEKDPVNFMWHSFWLIIRKSDRAVIGSADFKDTPTANREVEIGYGLGKEFEHNGYMTETVKAMCRWAMGQEGVSRIIAETDIDGFASQRILRRCGFAEVSRGETAWWKL